MSDHSYTYCILSYVHDPAVGESLNIGVVVYSREAGVLRWTIDDRYRRLSEAFAGFDGEHYRRVIRRANQNLTALAAEISSQSFQFKQTPTDAAAVARELWPDQGMSFRAGSALAGTTSDLDACTDMLFSRYVHSQYVKESAEEKRTDDQIWGAVYRSPLAQLQVSHHLVEKSLSTAELTVRFEHAFKNERWHLLKPLSLDLVKPESLPKKAAEWFGYLAVLRDADESAKLYFLVGKPNQASHAPAYRAALSILDRVPIEHEIVEEDAAEDFARRFAAVVEHAEADEAVAAVS